MKTIECYKCNPLTVYLPRFEDQISSVWIDTISAQRIGARAKEYGVIQASAFLN